MNINCSICSDLFVPTAAIYVTRCGHIFHYTCLIQWLERSKTCPQCRNTTNEKTIVRVFFNITTSEGINDDAVTLQSKLDSANLQLRLNERHVKSTEEKFQKISDEKTALEASSLVVKNELDKIKAGFLALKEQLKYYKDKVKYVEKAENEIQTLKENYRVKDEALRAITGDLEEAKALMKSACPETIAIIAAQLKLDIQQIQRKKENCFLAMKRAENELRACRKDLTAVTLERDILKHELTEHKKCEEKMQELKQQIAEMMATTSSVDPALVRVATESPAPMKRSRLMAVSSDLSRDSPSIADRVKQIKESDSPYLKIKSNSFGFLMKSQDFGARFEPSETSIFKKAMSSTTVVDTTPVPFTKPLADYSYDGFGGHSKDEKFPVTQKTTGIKRTKSSMSSKKFRKLSKPNQKLDDFLKKID